MVTVGNIVSTIAEIHTIHKLRRSSSVKFILIMNEIQ